MRSRPTSFFVVMLVVSTLTPTEGRGQTEQYVSSAGVRYRSQRDSGTVARAAAAYRHDPSVKNAVTLGTAQAGLRQFREAIGTFSRALERYPDEPLLYRWRGHRYLTLRDFVRAQADLETAIGLDSALYGAWYHLGVVHFSNGDFSLAADAFGRALPLAPDPAERAGSTDWLWMSLSRDGNSEAAAALLASRPDSIPAGNAYSRRLALYRAEIAADAVISQGDTADVQRATLSFGLGNWYAVRADTAQSRLWFERAVASGGWPAFGAIVAEAELAGRTTSLERVQLERLSSPCLLALSPSDLTRSVARAVVYWDPLAAPLGAAEAGAWSQVARMVQDAAEMLRRSLGSEADTLPVGDSHFSWRELEGTLLLSMHRDGRVTARATPNRPLVDRSTMAAIIALAEAFTLVRARGAAAFVWNDSLRGDSLMVPVRIEYREALGPDAPPTAMRPAVSIPLFIVRVPLIEKPAVPVPGRGPRYPAASIEAGAGARVRLDFVVDTTGRIRLETIREQWDSKVPRQRGALARHYDAFRAAVITSMPNLRFRPAEIAGCKVPQLVQQPFEFMLEGP